MKIWRINVISHIGCEATCTQMNINQKGYQYTQEMEELLGYSNF